MSHTDIAIKMLFDRWNASIKSCDSLINELSDEQLHKEIAPGKNRGIYLLGHLIAVHDDMLVFLGLGERVYPELHEPYIVAPDKSVELTQSVSELREMWNEQCSYLERKFAEIKSEQWFDKHTAVSEEDFAKEPHRNKLNIILTRTTHLQYHLGQMKLLK